jgi:SAM-dependent methyltransferase
MLRFREVVYLALEPFRWMLERRVRADLKQILRAYRQTTSRDRIRLLDVGARNSPYTTGLNAAIVLLDIPRETEIQASLNLGFTTGILGQLSKRRSNIHDVVVQDIFTNGLPDASFDVITAIEVIEHIEDDARFVRELCRLLKPGGVCYLTTPNGVAVPKENPDHVRHYTRRGLERVLLSVFDEVTVKYALKKDRYYQWGLQFWRLDAPVGTLKSIAGTFIHGFERARFPFEGANIIATCVKRV